MANYAGRLLQCSTIKRTAGFEEIDAVKTSTPAFHLRSGRDLEAQICHKYENLNVIYYPAEMFDVLARATKKYNQCCRQNLPALKI